MTGVNKVILIGRLGRDPEVRTLESGARMANLSIATGERWTDKNTGERQQRTEWHRVSIFNTNIVDVVEKYLRKGARAYLEGQLKTRKWTDRDGTDHYTTEVVLSNFRGQLVVIDWPEQTAPDSIDARLHPESARSDRSDIDDEIPF